MLFATVPIGDFRWTAGEQHVRDVKSSDFGHRQFCGRCGTPFLMQVDHQPETVDFSVATMDEPGAVAPGFHIFWASRLNWFDPGPICPGTTDFDPTREGSMGPSHARSKS